MVTGFGGHGYRHSASGVVLAGSISLSGISLLGFSVDIDRDIDLKCYFIFTITVNNPFGRQRRAAIKQERTA